MIHAVTQENCMPYTLVDGYRKKIKIRDHTGQFKYVAVCLPSVWPGKNSNSSPVENGGTRHKLTLLRASKE